MNPSNNPAHAGYNYPAHLRAMQPSGDLNQIRAMQQQNHPTQHQQIYPNAPQQAQRNSYGPGIPSSVEAALRNVISLPSPTSTSRLAQGLPPHPHPHPRPAEPTNPLHFQYNNTQQYPPQHTQQYPPQHNQAQYVAPLQVPTRRQTLPGPPSVSQHAPSSHVSNSGSGSPLPSAPAVRPSGDMPAPPPNSAPPPNQKEASQPSLDPIDPFILTVTDVALAPVRTALENTWNLTLTNMRQAMAKMHQDFTRIVTQERQKNAPLTSKVTHLECKLQLAEEESKRVEEENTKLKKESEACHSLLKKAQTMLAAYKDDQARLRAEKEELEVKYRVFARIKDTSAEGTTEGNSIHSRLDMASVLGAVSEQVSREMEGKMAAILNEIQEQKALRLQEQHKFAETVSRLKQATGQSGSSTTDSHMHHPIDFPMQSRPSTSHSHEQQHHPTHRRQLSSPQVLAQTLSLQRLPTPSYSPRPTADQPRPPPPPPPPPSASIQESPTTSQHHRDNEYIDLTTPPPEPLEESQGDNDSAAGKGNPATPASPPMEDQGSSAHPDSATSTTFSPVAGPSRKRSRADYETEHLARSPGENDHRQPILRIKTETEDLPDNEEGRFASVPIYADQSDSEELEVKTEAVDEYEEGQRMEVEEGEYEEGEVVELPQPMSVSTPPPPTALIPKVGPSGQMPMDRDPPPHPPVQRIPKALGISHIDLLYRTDNGFMSCRMCLTRKRDAFAARRDGSKLGVKKFPADASWNDLISHCQEEHPKACEGLAKRSPGEIAEMKQRMNR